MFCWTAGCYLGLQFCVFPFNAVHSASRSGICSVLVLPSFPHLLEKLCWGWWLKHRLWICLIVLISHFLCKCRIGSCAYCFKKGRDLIGKEGMRCNWKCRCLESSQWNIESICNCRHTQMTLKPLRNFTVLPKIWQSVALVPLWNALWLYLN